MMGLRIDPRTCEQECAELRDEVAHWQAKTEEVISFWTARCNDVVAENTVLRDENNKLREMYALATERAEKAEAVVSAAREWCAVNAEDLHQNDDIPADDKRKILSVWTDRIYAARDALYAKVAAYDASAEESE